MSEKPDFNRWARNIAWDAQLGEGLEFNLRYDLAPALEDAYRLGRLDAMQEQANDR